MIEEQIRANAAAVGEVMNALEAMAKAIYAKWDKLPGWVPWVDGGNSNMQELARDCARAALNALADNFPFHGDCPSAAEYEVLCAIRAAVEG